MTKMTYVQAINMVLEGNMNDEVAERLTALRETLVKRNGATRKPTKAQIENEELKAQMIQFFEGNDPQTASNVAVEFGITCQKATALLKQLVDNGKLEKFAEKRVTYFKEVNGE